MRGSLRIVFERDRRPAAARRPDRVSREEIGPAVPRSIEVAGAADGVAGRWDRLDTAEECLSLPEGRVRWNAAFFLDRRRVASMTDDGCAEPLLDRSTRGRCLVPVILEARDRRRPDSRCGRDRLDRPLCRPPLGQCCRTERCPLPLQAGRHCRQWESSPADAPGWSAIDRDKFVALPASLTCKWDRKTSLCEPLASTLPARARPAIPDHASGPPACVRSASVQSPG